MNERMKICRECKTKKSISKFTKQKGMKDGLRSECRSCRTAQMKAYRATPDGREAANRAARDYYRRGKLEAIFHYSQGTMACACCGEDTPEFLTIDHVNNDGAEHRRQTSDTSIGVVLKRAGWPEGYQVLCFNCNCGRARNGGVCPHESSRLRLVGEDRL